MSDKREARAERIIHRIAPVYNAASRVLILGSLPSPASRSFGFYYGHTQNIFWPLLAGLLGQADPPPTVEARRAFALAFGIALWDVLAEGEIIGAEDSSIRHARVNDFAPIFAAADIRAVFTTGKTAHHYYTKLAQPLTGREAIYLPSTSPANRAAQKKPEFKEAWQQIPAYLA
ncbi:MAG: DNA-deoxyinosine glycosylase [Clostridiales bacterium]|nr:DNA-deoxyinosine glycosylase [Clostridiales bacterium]